MAHVHEKICNMETKRGMFLKLGIQFLYTWCYFFYIKNDNQTFWTMTPHSPLFSCVRYNKFMIFESTSKGSAMVACTNIIMHYHCSHFWWNIITVYFDCRQCSAILTKTWSKLTVALETTVRHRTFSDHFMHLSEQNLLWSVILSEQWQAHDRRCTREWNYHMGWALLAQHNFMHTYVRANTLTVHKFLALTTCFITFVQCSSPCCVCLFFFSCRVTSFAIQPGNNFAWRLSRLQSTPGPFMFVRMQQ